MDDKTKYSQITLFNSEGKTNTSVRGKVHDSIVEIIQMSSEELKDKGENLIITYSFGGSPFGKTLIASTQKGICYMGFSDKTEDNLLELKNRFPNARFIEQANKTQENALRIFTQDWS